MQAIVLAGGFGTRLTSLVSGTPKPMADVGGRPFLCWLLEYMEGQGVREAVLCVHYHFEAIRSHFGNRHGRIRLHYSIEETPLGTGGAIAKALAYLKPTQPVVILNGDSLVHVDYREMTNAHWCSGRRLTLATRLVPDCSRYSRLTLLKNHVARFDVLGDDAPGYISAGFYVAAPGLFDGYALPQAFSFERDFLCPQTPQLIPAAFAGVDYFIDIGVPNDYLRAQVEIPAAGMMGIAA